MHAAAPASDLARGAQQQRDDAEEARADGREGEGSLLVASQRSGTGVHRGIFVGKEREWNRKKSEQDSE